ncbi:protein ecdysoneless homolog [Neolamprologus brichardi]|uniref:protein ecdysoneless homolog n=1 Tax=Neolamprologus brichardi TaxID=32507 RepID=UPI0016437B9D|nr:protein ecdysoneless homolog [Neolamprologus brichardi]
MEALQRRMIEEDMVQYKLFLIQPGSSSSQQTEERVEDNDGEFLLIEAADYLPKWLNPDTSENRVFLYKGELHILPCPSKSTSVGFSKDVVPSVAQALELLYTQPEVCRASSKISLALKKRLEGYPGKIKSGLHRAHCFIPAGIATVLAQRPDLIAPAVSAFYLRDPVDLQACRTFKTFPPDTRVLTLVTFTRCLYAQLQQQQFTPDRRNSSPCASFFQCLSFCYASLILSIFFLRTFPIISFSLCQPPGDSWLDITAQDLERLLQERSGGRADVGSQNSSSTKQKQHVGDAEERGKEKEDNIEEEEAGFSLVAISQGMKNFLKAMSSHEGAELPWSSATQPFNIDPDSMANALGRLLGGKDEELDSDDLDDSDNDEEEEEEVEEKEDGFCGQAEMKGTETLDSLKKYMDQMDEELMKTNVGQSFKRTNYNKAGASGDSSHPSARDDLPRDNKLEEKEEEIQPLDVDVNLVTNLLESLSSQAGLAGPASNLLQSLGIHLPPNSDPA